MIKSSRWNFKSMAGKVLLGLVVTAIMGSINVTPSYADNDRYRGKKYDHRRYDHRGPGYDNRRYDHRGPGYDNHRYGKHGRWHDRRGYRYYEDGYRHRIYVAPPIYRAPPPEPGIRIFFPPIYID